MKDCVIIAFTNLHVKDHHYFLIHTLLTIVVSTFVGGQKGQVER